MLGQWESGDLPPERAIGDIREAESSMKHLRLTSGLIDDVSAQLWLYQSGIAPADGALEGIRHAVDRAKMEAKAMHDAEHAGEHARELPPNTVDMPVGGAIPGCEDTDSCYTPTHLTVGAGTTVTWINSDGPMLHTVTAGIPGADAVGLDLPNGFDSDFMSGGATFEHTFDTAGVFDYYCALHHWMVGTVTVE